MRCLAPVLVLLLSLAGCTAPSPPAKPAAAPAPPPAPPARAAPEDWRDRPETPGGWTYGRETAGSSARFGVAGVAMPLFILRCDQASRRIILIRTGGAAGTLQVETSYSPMRWPAQVGPDGAAVSLAARDPFLDKLAFSRGRFTVSAAGVPELILPAWAEPARVIEDCRA